MTPTTNSCYDCCLSYPVYGCIYTPYNDSSFYEALAASGALSLGTSAGTDRSISAEFGGTTPHALSEYYGADTGVPSSGAIDFSDFHGTSSVDYSVPPITNCLWTHFDFSECTVGTIDKWATTSYATECQCMRGYYYASNTKPICWCPTKCLNACLTCICCHVCRYNGLSYLNFRTSGLPSWSTNWRKVTGLTMHGNANWLHGSAGQLLDPTTAAHTKIMVFGGRDCCNSYSMPFATHSFGSSPASSGHCICICDTESSRTGYCNPANIGFYCQMALHWTLRFYSTWCMFAWGKMHNTHFYGHDYNKSGPAYIRYCCPAGTIRTYCSDCVEWVSNSVDIQGPIVIGQRVNPESGVDETHWPGYTRHNLGWINGDCNPVLNTTPTCCSYYYASNPSHYYDCIRPNCLGGMDIWNNANMYYAPYCGVNGQMDCLHIGEYFLFNCALTDAEFCCVLLHLHNKWQSGFDDADRYI